MGEDRNIIIIGHPEREKWQLEIDNKEYEISCDKIKCKEENEDPFIWNDNFFYTFCHSNDSLSKGVRDLIENQNEEVYFVFVAKAEESILEIDTIIKAKELFEWPEKGKRNKDSLPKKFNKRIIECHLPDLDNGNLTEHNRKKLFTCIGDEEESFLPMKKYKENGPFVPYRLSKDISEKIWELITANGTNRYYVAKETSPRIKDGKIDTFKGVSKIISKIIDKYNEAIKDEHLSKLTGKQIKKFNEEIRAEAEKFLHCKS